MVNVPTVSSKRHHSIKTLPFITDKFQSFFNIICNKVFKSGLSKFWGRQPLKTFNGYGLLQTIYLDFFKGCLPQNLPSPLSNILSHFMTMTVCLRKYGIS